MSLIFRCTKKDCRAYYALSHRKCPKCNGKARNYYVSYRVDSKLKFKFAGETLSLAKETEAKITLTKGKGGEKPAIRCTLRDFAKEIFLPHFIAKSNPRLAKWNERHVFNVIANIPNKWLDEIAPADIEQCLADILKRGRSVSTRNNHLALLQGLFRFAVQMDYLKSSPVKSKK
jgi:hypothetical protein